MKVAIPTGASLESDPSFGLVIRLHPVRPPMLEMRDTQYLLTVRITRTTATKLNDELLLLEESKPRNTQTEWQYWMKERHSAVDALDRGEYMYYRYDPSCSAAEVLHAMAEVRYPITTLQSYKRDDDRTIRRILTSLQCSDGG